MINDSELLLAGKLGRAHGLEGQLNFQMQELIFDDEDEFPDWLFIKNEGYFVPYRIEEVFLATNNSGRILLSLCNTAELVKPLINCEFYFKTDAINVNNRTTSPAKLIGFTVLHRNAEPIGDIIDFENIPNNPCLVLKIQQGEMLLPFNEGIITEINPENKTITVTLPEGYLDTFA